MKINWGTSIVIAFALFIAFIMYFIVKVQSNSKYDNELVVEEYYKHDAHFSDELAKFQNTEDLKQKPSILTTADSIKIVFPKAIFPQAIEGKVSLYRPSAKRLDLECPFKLSGSTLLIPKRDFAGGNWDMILAWTYNGKSYLIKQKLYL